MIAFSKQIKTWILIFASLIFALMLMFLRLPSWAKWIYPQWLVVVILYLAWIMPNRINVGTAWVMGILLDFLYNVPVGENALALVTATYLIIRFNKKIEALNFWKKFAAILGLIMWCQLLPGLMQVSLKEYFNFWPIFSRAITSSIVWLIITSLFNNQRRPYFENYY